MTSLANILQILATLWENRGDYEGSLDLMNVPPKFHHLIYFVCQFCHREWEVHEISRKEKKARQCPHCKVALALKPQGQGQPGAWVPFFRWLHSYQWSESAVEAAQERRAENRD